MVKTPRSGDKATRSGKLSSTGSVQARSAAQTQSFVETVNRMRQANTASPEVARSKLKELGILSSDGRLSDKYK